LKIALPELHLWRDQNNLIVMPPLTVELGRHIVILGPSGCGKTTLLHVLAGVSPEQASLRDGEGRPWSGLNASLALVPQNPFWGFCAPTVEREIVFPLENMGLARDEQERRLERALQWAEIDHLRHRKPSTLSGGEAQRVHLAIAYARQPQIYLLDEPLAFLDPRASQEFVTKLGQLDKESITVVVDHDPQTWANWAHEWWIINEDGKLVPSTNSPKHESLNLTPAIKQSSASLLSVEDVWFTYDKKRWIFQRLSFDLHQGETLAIIGPSGSGKTTLFRLLTGLLKPNRGRLILHHLNKKNGAWRPLPLQEALYVPQNPEHYFWHSTVQEELEEDKAPSRLIEKYSLTHRLEFSPFWLSTGEQRRLTLACAQSQKRTFLLLDEPSFGLDRKSLQNLVEDLNQLQREGQTILLITHREDLAQLAHRQLVLTEVNGS